MNAFCPNLSNKQVKREFEELTNLFGEDMAYFLWNKNNGYSLDKALNGANSKLFLSLIDNYNGDREKALKAKAKVYTSEFTKWFGDWTKEDKTDVSKIVDENGEPLVVYHYTNDKFDTFDLNFFGKSDNGDLGKGFYVTPTSPIEDSEKHHDYFKLGYGDIIMPLFLNMRNPLSKDELHKMGIFWFTKEKKPFKSKKKDLQHKIEVVEFNIEDLKYKLFGDDLDYSYYREEGSIPNKMTKLNLKNNEIKLKKLKEELATIKEDYDINTEYNSVVEKLKKYDGVINGTFEILVPSANQLKSIDNNGQFSTENNNIYAAQQDNSEPYEVVKKFFDEQIYPRFRGNYYDFINKYGRANYDKYKAWLQQQFKSRFKHWDLHLSVYENHQMHSGFTRKDTSDYKAWENILFVEDREESLELNDKNFDKLFSSLISDAKGVSLHMQLVAELLKNCLKGKPVRFNVHPKAGILNGAAAKCDFDGTFYTIYIDSGAFFSNDSGFKNNLSQTILHELLHVVTEHALRTNETLQKQAEQLLKEVRAALGDSAKDYGLTNIYEFFAELSNEKFVEKLKSIKYNSVEEKRCRVETKEKIVYLTWKSLYDKVKEFVQKIAYSAIDREKLRKKLQKPISGLTKEANKYENTAYEEAVRLLMQSTFHDVSDAYDPTPRSYAMIQSQSANTEIQDEIYRQFDILHKYQQKMQNKTLNQQLRQNKVFEILTKLKTLTEQDSIKEVLEFANDVFGSFDGDIDGTLMKRLKDSKNLANPYDDISSEELCEMYQSQILFFDNLVNKVFDGINTQGKSTPYINDLLSKIRSSIIDAKSMWKDALDVVTDKLVEKWVNEDLIIVDQLGDNPTEVIKDYLHRNMFYQDTNNAYSWVFSLANQQSPLIKLAFNQIQKQETKITEESNNICVRLAKMYEKVNKLTRLNPFWQKAFMEFDKNGVPTGNFVRSINYGQYELDLNEFVEKLNNDFQQKYGYHYIIDGTTGEYVNSETGEFAYDEEWTDTAPTFIEYTLAIQKFKCDHANLRFSYDYYEERLSRPYDMDMDPNTVSLDYLFDHHGLSLKTLKKYNQIQSNINYYLSKCRDKETGLTYPERLTNPEDQRKLDMWTNELNALSNAYREDGSIKTDDELQMAYELKAWQRYVNRFQKIEYDYDAFRQEFEQFDIELSKYDPWDQEYQDINAAREIFVKYNSSYGINPKLLDMVFSGTTDGKEPADVTRARIQRSMIKQTLKGDTLVPELKRVANNIRFFIDCKRIDELIDKRGARNKANDFDQYFVMSPVLYKTSDGRYLDADFNKTDDEDEAITFQEYLIEYYTQQAIANGAIPGLQDNTGQIIDFSQMEEDDVREFFTSLFSIENTYQDGITGETKTQRSPLSIFQYLNPVGDIFFDEEGNAERTLIYVPKGRFTKKDSAFMNPNYDERQNIPEQPKRKYYDNAEAFNKMDDDADLRRLYNEMLNYMKSANEDMQLEEGHNKFRLPKIEASNSISLFRGMKNGKGLLKAVAEQYFDYNTNDSDNRTYDEQYVGPDQMVNHNVPIKYVGTLKDRYKYSYDVISSVIRYCTAALEYKYKKQIESDLQSIRYAQDPENRKENVNDTPHNREVYDYMMRQYMYKDSKIKSKYDKLSDMFRTAGVFQMLGMNVLSVSAGMFDSLTAIIRDGLVGRYFSAADLTRSLAYNIPTILCHILNYGKTIPNNKISAFNHMFGIGKNTKELSDQINGNRIKKFLGQCALGAYSVIDFMTNNIMLHAMLTSYRFYDGDVVPKGFYRLYDLQREFIKAGHKSHEAQFAYLCSCGRTLWGAYKYRNGELWLNPKYEPYVTLKIKNNLRSTLAYRAQVNNGTTPTDGKPRYSDSILGKFVGAMRGWMVSSLQDRLSGRDDVSVRKTEKVMEESVKNGKLVQKVHYKLVPKTKDQKERRKSWNFSTAMPQPEIAKAFTRALGVLCSTLGSLISMGAHKARKFSESESFAVKTVIVEIGLILGMIQSYQYVDDWCSDVRPVNLKKESPYSYDEYMDSKLYKEMVRNSYIRTVNSRIEQFDPTMVYDVVNSITTLSTAVKNIQAVPSMVLTGDVSNLEQEVVNGGNEVIRQGKFRGYTKWESSLRKSVGLINNIQSAFTYNGISTNTQYYARNYAWWLKYIDHEYHPQKLKYRKKHKHNDDFNSFSNGSDFNNPNGFNDNDFNDFNGADFR